MAKIKYLWVGEILRAGRWYTLWTTARHKVEEAQEAVDNHPGINADDVKEVIVSRFTRGNPRS